MMDEEAAIRAKIQAMKNLLQVKTQTTTVTPIDHRYHTPNVSYNNSYRTYPRPQAYVSRSWNRSWTKPVNIKPVTSTNRVWVNENAAKPVAMNDSERISPTAGKYTHTTPSQVSSYLKVIIHLLQLIRF